MPAFHIDAFSAQALSCSGMREVWRLSSLSQGERQDAPWTGLQLIQKSITNWTTKLTLTPTPILSIQKKETSRTFQKRPQPWFDPMTLVLCGNSADHHTTVLPQSPNTEKTFWMAVQFTKTLLTSFVFCCCCRKDSHTHVLLHSGVLINCLNEISTFDH